MPIRHNQRNTKAPQHQKVAVAPAKFRATLIAYDERDAEPYMRASIRAGSST
jgi:hypothetical protein